MFKKYLIIASNADKAGMNISEQLSKFRKNPIISSIKKEPSGFDFYFPEGEIIFTENIDAEKIKNYDFIIFASKHVSEKNEKSICIHAPGNWKTAEYGGEEGKICRSSALFQKFLFEKIKKNAGSHDFKKYRITLECTHHGPLIEKPCLFVEIGSTETEWKDKRAGFIVAKAISESIEDFEENPYREIAIGIGGPHYCPNFNKIQLNSNIAISHIIPQYALPFTEEMLNEAIKKTEEEIDFVVLDWKGIGIAEEREKIIRILDENRISYKKTSDIQNKD